VTAIVGNLLQVSYMIFWCPSKYRIELIIMLSYGILYIPRVVNSHIYAWDAFGGYCGDVSVVFDAKRPNFPQFMVSVLVIRDYFIY